MAKRTAAGPSNSAGEDHSGLDYTSTDHICDYLQGIGQQSRDVSEKIDTHLLAYASGAIGISIAFLDQVVGDGSPKFPLLLSVSWGLLAVSIGAVLASLLSAYFYSVRLTKVLREELRKPQDQRTRTDELAAHGFTFAGYTTAFGAVCFVVGIVFLLLFTFFNLERSNDRQEDTATSSATSQNPAGRLKDSPPVGGTEAARPPQHGAANSASEEGEVAPPESARAPAEER
jgi:hypothetical protein